MYLFVSFLKQSGLVRFKRHKLLTNLRVVFQKNINQQYRQTGENAELHNSHVKYQGEKESFPMTGT